MAKKQKKRKKHKKDSLVRLDPSAAVYVDSIEGQRHTWDTSSTHDESRAMSIESQERVEKFLMKVWNREISTE